MLQEFRYKNAKALQALPKSVQIKSFPPEFFKAAKKALEEVLQEQSEQSTDFKRVLKSYNAFYTLNKPWDDISTKHLLQIRNEG